MSAQFQPGYFSNRAPNTDNAHNPFDKLSQPDFDDFISGITSSLKSALGRHAPLNGNTVETTPSSSSPPPSTQDAEFSVSPSLDKGKQRDPREGPGLGGGWAQPIEILSSDDEESHSDVHAGDNLNSGYDSSEGDSQSWDNQTLDESLIQPEGQNTAFPSHHQDHESESLELPDAWEQAEEYTEDLYTGGDRLEPCQSLDLMGMEYGDDVDEIGSSSEEAEEDYRHLPSKQLRTPHEQPEVYEILSDDGDDGLPPSSPPKPIPPSSPPKESMMIYDAYEAYQEEAYSGEDESYESDGGPIPLGTSDLDFRIGFNDDAEDSEFDRFAEEDIPARPRRPHVQGVQQQQVPLYDDAASPSDPSTGARPLRPTGIESPASHRGVSEVHSVASLPLGCEFENNYFVEMSPAAGSEVLVVSDHEAPLYLDDSQSPPPGDTRKGPKVETDLQGNIPNCPPSPSADPVVTLRVTEPQEILDAGKLLEDGSVQPPTPSIIPMMPSIPPTPFELVVETEAESGMSLGPSPHPDSQSSPIHPSKPAQHPNQARDTDEPDHSHTIVIAPTAICEATKTSPLLGDEPEVRELLMFDSSHLNVLTSEAQSQSEVAGPHFDPGPEDDRPNDVHDSPMESANVDESAIEGMARTDKEPVVPSSMMASAQYGEADIGETEAMGSPVTRDAGDSVPHLLHSVSDGSALSVDAIPTEPQASYAVSTEPGAILADGAPLDTEDSLPYPELEIYPQDASGSPSQATDEIDELDAEGEIDPEFVSRGRHPSHRAQKIIESSGRVSEEHYALPTTTMEPSGEAQPHLGVRASSPPQSIPKANSDLGEHSSPRCSPLPPARTESSQHGRPASHRSSHGPSPQSTNSGAHLLKDIQPITLEIEIPSQADVVDTDEAGAPALNMDNSSSSPGLPVVDQLKHAEVLSTADQDSHHESFMEDENLADFQGVAEERRQIRIEHSEDLSPRSESSVTVAKLLYNDSDDSSGGAQSSLHQPSPPSNNNSLTRVGPLFHNHNNSRNKPRLYPLPGARPTAPRPQIEINTTSSSNTPVQESSPNDDPTPSTSPTSPTEIRTREDPPPSEATGSGPIKRKASQRTTRSHCQYHLISIPKAEDGEDNPHVHFLVPGCALSKLDVMEEYNIKDLGVQENCERYFGDIEDLLDPYLVGNIRKLVGVDLIRENEVYYVPGANEEIEHRMRLKPRHSKRQSRQFIMAERMSPLSTRGSVVSADAAPASDSRSPSFSAPSSSSSRAPLSAAGSMSSSSNHTKERMEDGWGSDGDSQSEAPTVKKRPRRSVNEVSGRSQSNKNQARNGTQQRRGRRKGLGSDAQAYRPVEEGEVSDDTEEASPPPKRKNKRRRANGGDSGGEDGISKPAKRPKRSRNEASLSQAS